ncbi:MAG TPA: NAD(P)/FAD-dependent oxidoreductase [Acidimicrobiales bacterium]|nr:NAD(P)/FAD-dependent oxidoreductase [Acidimicrobiales bacterium]
MTTTDAPPIDKAALKAKYAEERAKRLRPDGNDQYRRLAGDLLRDPHTPFTERPPVTDHVTVAFVGAGFAGLVTGARLAQAGIRDVRLVDRAGDVGGTWYWNRYPGAQCDTASLVYMPLLEETGHMPSEKYAHGPELLEHCQRIATQFGLYEHALFHTDVTSVAWDDTDRRWVIETNRGDRFTADHVAMGTGPLHVPKLPDLPDIETFEGHSFHTSRWDYDYTGGDRFGAPLTGLADKRVAIIGTGATAVQCIPHLARSAQRLYVFQRTPSSVDVRANASVDPDWFATIATPGWQKRWLANFTANQTGGDADEDLVQDGWTDLSRRIRERIAALAPDQRDPLKMWEAWEDSDFEKMEEIRRRIDAVVTDPDTAYRLKAWYRQLCKRPCFHDEYLDAFNEPGCVLVDTDGQGVSRITEHGVVVGETEYEVDCIIWSTGFEVGTDHTSRRGFDVAGRDGRLLSEHWADGMRSLHGIHVHGFPNLYVVQPSQGANLISNVPHNLTESGETIAAVVAHAVRHGYREVEVTAEAEQAWLDLLLSGPGRMLGSADCTPGYYNNEGQPPGPMARTMVGHPQGATAFFDHIERWRTDGEFAGLDLRR